jgi:NAD(P)-dependent dehydrogenase (short-subunit alcohol dehydrogenase family)
MEFDGRVAVITGCRGMGRAIAVTLAERGASLAIADKELGLAETAAADVHAVGGQAIALEVDVSLPEDVGQMTSATIERFGRIDFLIATSAIQFFDTGALLETDLSQWSKTLDVNLTGVYLCAKECLPHMIAAGGGGLVAISSDCAIRTSPRAAAYTASKAGLIGLVRSIAVDYGAQKIRANTIIPGVTATPGLLEAYGSGGRVLEESLAQAAALSPLGRVGRASDIAEAVAFLCSDRSCFVTGTEFFVDGGMTVTYAAD